MSVPNWREPQRGDQFSAEIPVWAWELLKAYSKQLKALTDALQGGLTSEHERSDVRTVTVRHDVPIEVVSTKVKTRPVGVQVLGTSVPCGIPLFEATGEGRMSITVHFTSTPPPTGDVEITIKMVGG